MLPSVFRLEELPSLRLEVRAGTVSIFCLRATDPMLVCWTKAWVIAELPMDSVLGMVEGKDEGFEFGWQFDRWEEFAEFWKDASRWSVCWVGRAGDVSSVDHTFMFAEKNMDSFEDLVDVAISASSRPPTFDDTSVVSINFESRAWGGVPEDDPDEELHSDCFGPRDVLAVRVPS